MKALCLSDDHLVSLIAAVTMRGGHLTVRAHGGSMQPAVREGDVLVLGPVAPLEPRPAQIVIVGQHGKLLAHRVGSVNEGVIITRGDNRGESDPPHERRAIVAMVREVRSDGRSLWWRIREKIRGAFAVGVHH